MSMLLVAKVTGPQDEMELGLLQNLSIQNSSEHTIPLVYSPFPKSSSL